jgi:hypothetical protein
MTVTVGRDLCDIDIKRRILHSSSVARPFFGFLQMNGVGTVDLSSLSPKDSSLAGWI